MPPCWRANSQLNSAVRALPTCNCPVGDGANRARTFLSDIHFNLTTEDTKEYEGECEIYIRDECSHIESHRSKKKIPKILDAPSVVKLRVK